MKVEVKTRNFLENPKRYGGVIFLLPSIEFGFGGFFCITISWICLQISFYLTKEDR
jgi:hypothetical protein